MEWLIITLVILFSLFLQLSIFASPLFLGGLLTLFVLFHKARIIVLAFLVGIISDILSFQTPGITSLFLLLLFAFVLLYERKFEIQTVQFLAAFTFLSSLVYMLLFHNSHPLGAAIVATIWSMVLFFLVAFLDARLPLKKRV